MANHQLSPQFPRGFIAPRIGRGTGVLLILLAGVARMAWAAENPTWLPEEARSAASLSIYTGCPACARYSRAAFRLHARQPIPWPSNHMSLGVREKLRSGVELAMRQVREIHECHDLFSQLGADGIDKLTETLYLPANLYREHNICRRAVAFVVMEGSPTWLCRGFARLSDRQAAMTLIHEALHHAGLGEGKNGPTSIGINMMVMRACGL